MRAVLTGPDREEPRAAAYKSRPLSDPRLVYGSFCFAITGRTDVYAVKRRTSDPLLHLSWVGWHDLVPKCKFCVHFVYLSAKTELHVHYCDWSRGSSVTIVTRTQAGRSVCRTPSKARYFIFSKHPSQPILLFHYTGRSFSRNKAARSCVCVWVYSATVLLSSRYLPLLNP